MDSREATAAPALTTYEELAQRIDHTLLRPDLTEMQVAQGCELAKRYLTASATVRPCDIDIAVRILEGSGVAPGSVAGFPHGSQNTGTKLYELRDLLRRGAKEIDAVVNISKLLSRQFQYIETELLQMADACHKESAKLKVILETAYLTDELKIVACRIASRAEADFVQTSTDFASAGYSLQDLALMRKNAAEDVGLKAAGGVQTLEEALTLAGIGCARLGTTATATILDAWKERLRNQAESTLIS